MLKPGTYILTRDVVNPKPDRRKKDTWSAEPTWTQGTEFLVVGKLRDVEIAEGLAPDVAARLRERTSYTTIRMVGARWGAIAEVGPGNAEKYAALEEALEPCSESNAALLERLDAKNDYFAQWLLESGRLDHDTFERLWAAFEADGDLTSKDWPRRGRRLVEEAAAEEFGIETTPSPVCRACRNPMPNDGSQRACRGRTGAGWCSQ